MGENYNTRSVQEPWLPKNRKFSNISERGGRGSSYGRSVQAPNVKKQYRSTHFCNWIGTHDPTCLGGLSPANVKHRNINKLQIKILFSI
jgi:hypothetical protein